MFCTCNLLIVKSIAEIGYKHRPYWQQRIFKIVRDTAMIQKMALVLLLSTLIKIYKMAVDDAFFRE